MTGEAKPKVIDTYRTSIIVLVCTLTGVILLIISYFVDAVHPFASFLALQIGGLLVFGAGYTAVSDYFVRKNFEREVRTAIDFVRLDQTIKDMDLTRVMQKFSTEELSKALNESSVVFMLVLRSDGFFRSSIEELRHRVEQGTLTLTVLLPNPCNVELMTLLSAKFADYNDPQDLARSIQRVVNVWLKQEMFEKLTSPSRQRLSVSIFDKYPLYSAYVFDKRELWYIPYHHRNNYQLTPTFIFGRQFDRTEIYRDITALTEEAQVLDLTKNLTLPKFRADSALQQ